MRRREFLKTVGGAAVAGISLPSFGSDPGHGELQFSSDFLEADLSPSAPEFLRLTVDALGKRRRGSNIIKAPAAESGYRVTSHLADGVKRVAYYPATASHSAPAAWIFEFTAKKMVLTSEWSPDGEAAPVVFNFDLAQVHSTVLGLFRKDGLLSAPAVMHVPDQGSIRVSASVPGIGLIYTSVHHRPVASLSLPPASEKIKRIVYTLEAAAIYPEVSGIGHDPRFDGFRRNWLNALQLDPSALALANNTSSTSCAFCYYEYGDIAALTPLLAEGLTALNIVRQTLDRVLAGGTAYGLPAPENFPSAASDTFPSMLIVAADCVRGGGSDKWLAENYDGIRGWAESMLATDSDGDGLIKYKVSGNSGIWPDGFPKVRPSNWWDTIGFGYEDAYANALAYRALHDMAMLAQRLGKSADVMRYRAAAEKMRQVYYQRFFDPATGVLGGWRSADGQLHDYYFLWVNGIAIHYGLVEKSQANAIMDKLMEKMKAVGYGRFDLGLPGNLITVALKDYVHKVADAHTGGGVRPDNSDGFQNYENGGATGCFAFFTLAALYDLGRREEADRILFAMLDAYDRGGFEGRGANGRTNDWRRWDGTPKGYEGFLSDNYYALMAVPLRQNESRWKSGFRHETVLT
jgi:Bacterial alpha-L-rhamnosidase 6 hairpin glycosidase domain